MNRHWTLLLVAAFVVGFVAPSLAATPLTLERHQDAAERVAPRFPTAPGKTLCVCQTADDPSQAYVGYLNFFLKKAGDDTTINMVCAYPVFTPGLGLGYCSLFQVIK